MIYSHTACKDSIQKKTNQTHTPISSLETHMQHSFGKLLLCCPKMRAVSSIARKKHSAIRLESAGTPGWHTYRLNAIPWTHTPWSFILGRIIEEASFEDWTTRFRGRLHLDWSIPSLGTHVPPIKPRKVSHNVNRQHHFCKGKWKQQHPIA